MPARLERTDLPAVEALLVACGLHVDLEAELAREISLPWVARDEHGKVAAFLLAWSVADELHLLDMGTAPAARRKGHARSLLAELVSLAQREHKRLVLLEVRAGNAPAIALYESIGFARMNVRRGYYSDTGEDALEMSLTLDPATGQILREPS